MSNTSSKTRRTSCLELGMSEAYSEHASSDAGCLYRLPSHSYIANRTPILQTHTPLVQLVPPPTLITSPCRTPRGAERCLPVHHSRGPAPITNRPMFRVSCCHTQYRRRSSSLCGQGSSATLHAILLIIIGSLFPMMALVLSGGMCGRVAVASCLVRTMTRIGVGSR